MLPTLENASPTIHSLHTVAVLLGAVRLLVFERQPNYLELGLKIKSEGLSTDVLPTGGDVTLDFRQLALVYTPAAGAVVSLPLSGQTQAALLETLLRTIYTGELATTIPYAANNSYTDAAFTVVEGFVNRIKPKRDHYGDTTPLQFDAQAARDYATTLYSIFTAEARFRACLNGSLTPVVVWPEHFDLSFLWFAAQADEQHPHINFGFAPYSAGIDEPYLYAYAYPYPAKVEAPQLPAGARWNTEGWTGVVLPYSEIARQSDSEAYVEASCVAIFKALRTLLG